MSQKVGLLQLKKKIQKPSTQEKKVPIPQKVDEDPIIDENVEQEIEKTKVQQFNPVEMASTASQGKTQAEVQFDLVRLKRLGEKIEKKMELSYRQKIERFNKKIQKMPEHYDIPKVGPG